MIMTLFSQPLTLDTLKWPTSTSRNLLAFFHSGDLLRTTIPRLLRIGVLLWLCINVLLWSLSWPSIYEQFERWGLVKAFFLQVVTLGTLFLVTRITFLRSHHLETMPSDDFANLRAVAVLSRWLGEIVLVYVLGSGLSNLLQPISAGMNALAGALSPSMASSVSEGTPKLLIASAPLSMLWIGLGAVSFLLFYTFANAIDLGLAIEFNTRAERVGKRIS
jgi:hypothetical protein